MIKTLLGWLNSPKLFALIVVYLITPIILFSWNPVVTKLEITNLEVTKEGIIFDAAFHKNYSWCIFAGMDWYYGDTLLPKESLTYLEDRGKPPESKREGDHTGRWTHDNIFSLKGVTVVAKHNCNWIAIQVRTAFYPDGKEYKIIQS